MVILREASGKKRNVSSADAFLLEAYRSSRMHPCSGYWAAAETKANDGESPATVDIEAQER